MTAEATTGGATIELEFGLGRNLSEVLALTNNALSQVPHYPDNVDRPRIFTTAFSDNYFMLDVIDGGGQPARAGHRRPVRLRRGPCEGGARAHAGRGGSQGRRRRRAPVAGVRGPGASGTAAHSPQRTARCPAGPQPGHVRWRHRRRQAPLPGAHAGPFRGRRRRTGRHRRPARRHPGVCARSGADRTDARGCARIRALAASRG